MVSTGTIAAAQTVPVRGDVTANVAQHLQLIESAAAAEAQLLVFPELSLTGYELELADELAFARDDPRLAPLRDAAAATNMTLIVGAPLRLDERLRIGAFILTPERSLEVYTKRHLGAFPPAAARDGTIPPAEETVFVAGDANPLVHVGDARAAVAICADTGHASHALAAAERGARLYLASTFVIPSDFANVSETLAQRAREHALTVVFANFGGPSGGLAAAGRSAIRSATGELVVQLPARGAGVATATRTGTDWRGSARML